MLTEFGKILRKIRIDSQELLRDMALKLNVSSAYLSAVENGKRKIPEHWKALVGEQYNLSAAEKKELSYAYDVSACELRIPLDGTSNKNRELAVSFAKAFDELSDAEIQKIMDVVNHSKRGGHHKP